MTESSVCLYSFIEKGLAGEARRKDLLKLSRSGSTIGSLNRPSSNDTQCAFLGRFIRIRLFIIVVGTSMKKRPPAQRAVSLPRSAGGGIFP